MTYLLKQTIYASKDFQKLFKQLNLQSRLHLVVALTDLNFSSIIYLPSSKIQQSERKLEAEEKQEVTKLYLAKSQIRDVNASLSAFSATIANTDLLRYSTFYHFSLSNRQKASSDRYNNDDRVRRWRHGVSGISSFVAGRHKSTRNVTWENS